MHLPAKLRPATLALTLLATPVLAAPPPHPASSAHPAPAVEAAMVAKQAIDYYQNGQFALAAELYRRAYRIDPTKPEYLYGVGRSEQKAGRVAEARLAFTALRGLLPSTDPYFRKCEQALDELNAVENPPAVDAKPVEVVPAAPVQVQTPAIEPSHALPWTLVATGGALFVTGLAVTLSTISDANAWGRHSTTTDASGQIIGTDYQSASNTVSSLNTRTGVGIGLGVGGLVCAGVGTWLLLHNRDSVTMAPTSNGVVIGGRF
jgi:tetratricopeptide (TPR) repeat protein